MSEKTETDKQQQPTVKLKVFFKSGWSALSPVTLLMSPNLFLNGLGSHEAHYLHQADMMNRLLVSISTAESQVLIVSVRCNPCQYPAMLREVIARMFLEAIEL